MKRVIKMNPKITEIETTNFINITPKSYMIDEFISFDSFSEVFMGMHGIFKSSILSKLLTHPYVDWLWVYYNKEVNVFLLFGIIQLRHWIFIKVKRAVGKKEQ